MSKISELSDGGSLVSSDYLIAVRSGGNVKVRMDQINVDQVDLGDNEFIRLGNSQDLTMVHTSTQSIINQAGIGDLLIQKAGATKLTINATGIDVTGTVTASGPIILTAGALAAAGNAGLSHRSTDNKVYLQAGTGGFNILDDQQNTHFYIDSAGVSSFNNNVGIGTSTFTSASAGRTVLEVNGASASALINLSVNGTRQGYIFTDTTDMNVYNVDNGSLNFGTNNTLAATIDSSGNVSIGTSNSLGVLTIKAPASDDEDIITITEDGINQAFSINGNFAGSGSTGNAITLDSYWADDIISFRGDGNVGIGNPSPTDKLHLGTSSGATQLKIQSGSGINNCILHTNGTTDSWRTGMNLSLTDGSYEFYDDVNNVSRMTIDASGNVGIGGTTGERLTVTATNPTDGLVASLRNSGTSGLTGTKLWFNQNTVDNWNIGQPAGVNAFVFCNSTGSTAERMRINASGNVGIGASSALDNKLEVNGGSVRVRGTSTPSVKFNNGDLEAVAIKLNSGATGTLGLRDNKVLIDASGNVGIGVTPKAWSVYNAIQIGEGALAGGEATAYGTSLSSNAYYDGSWKYLTTDESAEYKMSNGVHAFRIAASGTADSAISWTTAMTLDASGNLLVGTSSFSNPTSGFTVSASSETKIQINHIVGTGSGVPFASFRYNQSEIGKITQNGTSAVLYATSSDQRLKENIADADDAGSKIDAIQVRKFDWKVDGSHQDYGMVAQELLEVAPEAVSQGETEDDMMGVDYSKLVPMMLKEIQSLRARIAALES